MILFAVTLTRLERLRAPANLLGQQRQLTYRPCYRQGENTATRPVKRKSIGCFGGGWIPNSFLRLNQILSPAIFVRGPAVSASEMLHAELAAGRLRQFGEEAVAAGLD